MNKEEEEQEQQEQQQQLLQQQKEEDCYSMPTCRFPSNTFQLAVNVLLFCFVFVFVFRPIHCLPVFL